MKNTEEILSEGKFKVEELVILNRYSRLFNLTDTCRQLHFFPIGFLEKYEDWRDWRGYAVILSQPDKFGTYRLFFDNRLVFAAGNGLEKPQIDLW